MQVINTIDLIKMTDKRQSMQVNLLELLI